MVFNKKPKQFGIKQQANKILQKLTSEHVAAAAEAVKQTKKDNDDSTQVQVVAKPTIKKKLLAHTAKVGHGQQKLGAKSKPKPNIKTAIAVKDNKDDEEESVVESGEDTEEEADKSIAGEDNEKSTKNKEHFKGAAASKSEPVDEETSEEEDASSSASAAEEQQKPKSAADLTASLLQKYKERKGTRLYIRFTRKVPLDDDAFQKQLKELSSLIVRSNRPRQRHARFCLAEFDSQEDRDRARKEIKEKAKTEKKFRGIVASIPRTENDSFVQELARRKQSTLENKKARKKLRREQIRSDRTKHLTSSIVVLGLTSSATVAELRKVIPNAVDIQMKRSKDQLHGGGFAAVTMPSPMEASRVVKSKLTMGNRELIVRYDKRQMHKQERQTHKKEHQTVKKEQQPQKKKQQALKKEQQ